MKKTLLMLSLVVVMLGWGVSRAYAVPVTDGVLGAGEWANLNFSAGPYPYYLEVFDPDEADNQIQNMDISHGVLLQELSGAFGGTPATTDDGIYLLLEVYGPPPSLAFATGAGVVPTAAPVIKMEGDLLGDGNADAFNIYLRHYNTLPVTGLAINDVVDVCVGSFATCNSIGAIYLPLTGSGGSFGRGSVLEYYVPSGTFGTPPSPPGTPFPFSFKGTLTYDNGASGPNTSDDVVVGQLGIPEPSTLMLLGTSLLGLIGFGKFKFWQ